MGFDVTSADWRCTSRLVAYAVSGIQGCRSEPLPYQVRDARQRALGGLIFSSRTRPPVAVGAALSRPKPRPRSPLAPMTTPPPGTIRLVPSMRALRTQLFLVG